MNIETPDELLAYLKMGQRIGQDERPGISVLKGGVSNRTVLVESENGQAWVIKQAPPKLRVEVDWFSDPARSHREAMGTKYLAELAPPGAIPRLIFEDEENHLLAMEAVARPHENLKAKL